MIEDTKTRRTTGHEMTKYEHRHTLPSDIAAMLRRHRLALGWSYRRASQETGISLGHLAMLEAGARCPSVVLAEELITAYEMNVQDAEALRAASLVGVGRDWASR